MGKWEENSLSQRLRSFNVLFDYKQRITREPLGKYKPMFTTFLRRKMYKFIPLFYQLFCFLFVPPLLYSFVAATDGPTASALAL